MYIQDFVVDLRERLRAVGRELDGSDPNTRAHKLATYHASCIHDGWPRHSSQALRGALPIRCLDTYSWT